MRERLLKIRVSKEELESFEAACQFDDVSPATKGRELILEYTSEAVRRANCTQSALDGGARSRGGASSESFAGGSGTNLFAEAGSGESGPSSVASAIEVAGGRRDGEEPVNSVASDQIETPAGDSGVRAASAALAARNAVSLASGEYSELDEEAPASAAGDAAMPAEHSEDDGKSAEAPAEDGKTAPDAAAVAAPVNAADDFALPQLIPGRPLRVGEMFSGPGGIGIALNRAKSDRFAFEHAWATDWDADTCRTYRQNVLKHAPDALSICEDVRKLDIDSLPVVDGFLYGFPCNDFSLVGESKGLHGSYGGLYSYGVKFISRANPLFFFAENVSGLSSANDGKAFKMILNALNHAGRFGYTVTANLYKFEDYGVPQARHRYIMIGIRGDLGLTFKVPKPSGVMKSCREALANIPASAANQETTRQSKTVEERLSWIREGENVWQAEEAGRLPERLRLNVKGARLSQIYRRLDSAKPSYTITGSGGGGTHVYHWSENRALTNRERARLQTFPDDFVFCGSKESVRKQIGMAVPCDGAQVILEALLKTFEGTPYESVEPSVGVFPAGAFRIED